MPNVAAVERAHLGAHLAEPGVVRGDGQIADQVEHVPAADGVPGDHGHHRLGQPADLDLQIGDVEPADRARLAGVGEVAGVAPHPLVAAGAERVRALTGQDDHPDLGVLPGDHERIGDLDQGLRAERVADLGAADRHLGDAVLADLQADVLVAAGR
jgi:hypothetical protein